MMQTGVPGGEAKGIRGLWQRAKWTWSYRYFLWMFVYQRVKTQYAGTVLGLLWSLLTPLMMTVVFTLVSVFITPGQDIRDYPIYLLTGLLPWYFFSNGLSSAAASIVSESSLVKKVRFPVELLPIGSVLGTLPNFLGGLIVFFVLALVLGVGVTWWVLLLPVVMAIEILFAVGLGFILATANVFYRDVYAMLQVALQAWFFLTPVWYSMDVLPQSFTVLGRAVDVWRWIRIFNPMASIIAAYRDILYWGRLVDPAFLARTGLTTVMIFIVGYSLFVRHCSRFPEEL